MQTKFVAFILLCPCAVATAGDQPEKKDPAPAAKNEAKDDDPYVTDASYKDGVIQVTRAIVEKRFETRTRQVVTADGKVVSVTEKVYVPTTKHVVVALDAKSVALQTRDGKPVGKDDVAKALQDKIKVIVSPTGRPVGEDFLLANKDAKYILLLKPAK